jgi:hypothetical protein
MALFQKDNDSVAEPESLTIEGPMRLISKMTEEAISFDIKMTDFDSTEQPSL